MNYTETLNYIWSIKKFTDKTDLKTMKVMMQELGNPQQTLKVIHVAGTNGKGSVCNYIASSLVAAGYRTGLYLSPFLEIFNERMRVNGNLISDDDIVRLSAKVKPAAERAERECGRFPKQFEFVTAIAFLYFAEQNCDYVVLETGMGGLLDATNIIEKPVMSIITSVGLDHTHILGNTLEEIARDKAGIIKKGAEVVTGRQAACVKSVLEETSCVKGCRITEADLEKLEVVRRALEMQVFTYGEFEEMEIRLAGQHQIENAVTVLEAVRALRRQGVDISDTAVRAGLRKTRWSGRMMVLEKHPLVIADGAHNEDAVRRLAENLDIYLKGKKVTAVLGVFKDKEYEKMIGIMTPYLDYVYAIDLPNRDRTLAKEELCEVLAKYGIGAEPAVYIEQALVQAKKRAGKDGVVLAFGSLSYLGEVIRLEENAERK